MNLEEKYTELRTEILVDLAERIELELNGILNEIQRIDRISCRAKTVKSFINKSNKTDENGNVKYSDPLNEIQDQIGARITVFYKSDVDLISEKIEKYYRNIENRKIVPDSEWEFSYFGKHYILFTSTDCLVNFPKEINLNPPNFFELQIKTLFQHAWSEGQHDLGYKPELGQLTDLEKRKLALSSAQAWGADQIMDELYKSKNGIEELTS